MDIASLEQPTLAAAQEMFRVFKRNKFQNSPSDPTSISIVIPYMLPHLGIGSHEAFDIGSNIEASEFPPRSCALDMRPGKQDVVEWSDLSGPFHTATRSH